MGRSTRYTNKIKLYVNNINDNAIEPDDASYAQKYFSAFGLIKNTEKLLYSEYGNEYKHIELLNGLRVVCMVWLIYLHTYTFQERGPIINIKDYFDFQTMFVYSLNYSAPLAADIFFWISGFLAVYLLM